LNYFEEADADLFVGREALTTKLVERTISLASSRSPTDTRFLAVVGASGSGKSSLVHAGLIPALRWHKDSRDWQIALLTPTAHPLESLATSLTEGSESVSAITTLMDDLARDARSLQLFAKRKLGSRNGSRLLLVIDQFEELFALCRSEEGRTAFIDNLSAAASEEDSPVIVVIAMRADFYAHCANYVQLREALAKNQEYIGAMSEEELRRAIEEPARRGRWEFEPGLVDLLLHDVGQEPGALPLLSHALMETWHMRRGRTMTLSGYTTTGSVRGAIAETAEVVFLDLFTREQREIARRIFLRLTELGDETSTGDTRRRATFNELILRPEDAETTEYVLKVLADARLITTSEDSVEVAHEALIREWPTLRGWLEDNREGLRLHRQLTDAAWEWNALNRDPDMLYRGARLTQVQEWAAVNKEEMNKLEEEFLEASISSSQRETAEREAQRQRELEAAQKLAELEKQRAEEQAQSAAQLNKRARYLTGAFIIALLMAFTALFFSSQARQTATTAQKDRRIATSRELAAASLNNLNVDPERSILLALESVSTTRSADGTILPESLEALHRALVASPVRMTLNGHGTGVLSADYSPDGSRLATIGQDGTVIVWNAASGEELLRMPGTSEPIDFVTTKRVAFSADGELLVACDRNLIKIYDPLSGNLIKELNGHQAYVTAIDISTDSKYVASGSFDGSAMIWDVSTGDIHAQLAGHADAIEELAFSPDGRWLVTAGDDAALKFWDVLSGDLLLDYTDFTGIVGGVTFSPDGNRLAFSDESIHVWQFGLNSGDRGSKIGYQEVYTISTAASNVFSPDGRIIAGWSGSATSGNVIKLWDAATGRELLTLFGHTGWVMGLAFSPDSQWLASTSLDGTVRVWSLRPGNEGVSVSTPLASFGTRFAYNPNRQEFVTNGGDGTATLWNAETGEPRLTLRGHDLTVLSLAFRPDGERLATGSEDATAIVWDTITSQKLFALTGHEVGVRDIAFSPDGELIGTGGFDGTAKIWNANTGELIHDITGHQGLVLGVAFSPDGKYLATASTDATVMIWNVTTGERTSTLTGHEAGVREVVYSPDGRMIATGSGDGMVILWDAATGSNLKTLIGHNSGIQSLAFTSDGKLLASGSEDNTAKLWDVETGAEILTFPGSSGGVTAVAFSPTDHSAHLAVASADGIVRMFLLQIDELLAVAKARITRTLTVAECQEYLHVEQCPAEP
jgi:WD40 repeat protein